MGVAFGGTKAGVTEEGLDITNVGTAFQKMSGKRVAQTVDRDFFRDFCMEDGFVENVLGGSNREWAGLAAKAIFESRKGRNIHK